MHTRIILTYCGMSRMTTGYELSDEEEEGLHTSQPQDLPEQAANPAIDLQPVALLQVHPHSLPLTLTASCAGQEVIQLPSFKQFEMWMHFCPLVPVNCTANAPEEVLGTQYILHILHILNT